MKVTIVHTNNKKQLLVSTKTMEKLMERFARDDSKLTITHFRESVPYLSNNYEGYKDMPKWMHIYPATSLYHAECLDRIVTLHLHSYPTATCMHHGTC